VNFNRGTFKFPWENPAGRGERHRMALRKCPRRVILELSPREGGVNVGMSEETCNRRKSLGTTGITRVCTFLPNNIWKQFVICH
jgi:hypothetical protein